MNAEWRIHGSNAERFCRMQKSWQVCIPSEMFWWQIYTSNSFFYLTFIVRLQVVELLALRQLVSQCRYCTGTQLKPVHNRNPDNLTVSEWWFYPCWYLRPYSGREYTIFILIQSRDDNKFTMMEKKQKVESHWSPCTMCPRYSGPLLSPTHTVGDIENPTTKPNILSVHIIRGYRW